MRKLPMALQGELSKEILPKQNSSDNKTVVQYAILGCVSYRGRK